MENDAYMDDDFIDAAFMNDMTTPILLPSLTPETFSPLMLEPYGHAIYQQELPFPQGQNDVFAPEMLFQSYITISHCLNHSVFHR
ncbi:hypothetical protein K3495_g14092 [Podosphaera aphanis]|nr:hypothetical protein K3495_g14092 [Podosphaera aphanis]